MKNENWTMKKSEIYYFLTTLKNFSFCEKRLAKNAFIFFDCGKNMLFTVNFLKKIIFEKKMKAVKKALVFENVF